MNPGKINSIFIIGFILFLGCIEADAQFLKFLKRNKSNRESNDVLQDAEYVFSEGMKEYLLENYSKALSAFERSAAEKHDNAAAYYMIGQIYVKQRNYYKALDYAQKALKIDENNKYYYLLVAQIYNQKQDFNEESKVYLALLKKVPNTEEHYYDLAGVYYLLGKYEDAIKSLDKLEKYYGISEDITKQKQELYLKLGKLNEAVAEGKKLIDAFPDEPRYVINLIEMLIANEKIDEAEKLTQDLAKTNPHNAFVNLLLADIYTYKKDFQKAEEKLQEAFRNPDLDIDTKVGRLITKLRLISNTELQDPENDIKKQCLVLGDILVKTHPYDSKAYAMNGDILVLSGKSREALTNYLQSIKLDNSHFKIWQQIAILDFELKNDSLKRHSEQALELFPTQSIFWYYNGLAYYQNQNYKKAAVSFEEGKKLTSKDKNMLVQFSSMLGDCYNGLKEFKKSDDAFEDALKEDANNMLVLNNYSYYLSLRKDKLDYAKKMSERVIKDNPDNVTYLDTYAWILYVMKEYSKAKDIFEKIADKADNGTIVEHYGDVLYQLGQKEKALEQWKRAKTLGEISDVLEKKIADRKLYEQ